MACECIYLFYITTTTTIQTSQKCNRAVSNLRSCIYIDRHTQKGNNIIINADNECMAL